MKECEVCSALHTQNAEDCICELQKNAYAKRSKLLMHRVITQFISQGRWGELPCISRARGRAYRPDYLRENVSRFCMIDWIGR